MKTLYESILDDEDEIMNRMDNAEKEKKNEIISFIDHYYSLVTSDTYRLLDIKKYIKINKDWSVDIKYSKSSRHQYILKVNYLKDINKKDYLPVNGFTWGDVQSLELYCEGSDKEPILPRKCETLNLSCTKLKSINLSNTKITRTICIKNGGKIKHIDFNGDEEMQNIYLYDMPDLEIISGLPKRITNMLVLYNCPKLHEVNSTEVNYFTYKACDSLTDEELKKIKCKTIVKK